MSSIQHFDHSTWYTDEITIQRTYANIYSPSEAEWNGMEEATMGTRTHTSHISNGKIKRKPKIVRSDTHVRSIEGTSMHMLLTTRVNNGSETEKEIHTRISFFFSFRSPCFIIYVKYSMLLALCRCYN